MNPEDMSKFVESLNEEQRAQFELVFKAIGDQMDVKVKVEKEETYSSDSEVKEDFRVTKTTRDIERGRTPVKARKNRWEDTGEFQLPENEEEWEGSRKRSERGRNKASKVKLECSTCGKTYYENPNLVYGEYHRCNRCGGK